MCIVSSIPFRLLFLSIVQWESVLKFTALMGILRWELPSSHRANIYMIFLIIEKLVIQKVSCTINLWYKTTGIRKSTTSVPLKWWRENETIFILEWKWSITAALLFKARTQIKFVSLKTDQKAAINFWNSH